MREGACGGKAHVAVTSSPVRMTSHARAVASIPSPLGGAYCVGAARPAPLDKAMGKRSSVGWGRGDGGVNDHGECRRSQPERPARGRSRWVGPALHTSFNPPHTRGSKLGR